MAYRLDLRTLLLMLGHSTGHLYADLPRLQGVKSPCQIFLDLVKGSIVTGSVRDQQGNEIISGEAAVKLVHNHVLEWHFTAQQPAETQQRQTAHLPVPAVPTVSSPIPYRTYHVPQNEFMTWPRLFRAVYALIDGKNSVNHVVMLLAHEQRSEKVLEVFAVLQRHGLIIFDKNY